MLILIAAGGWQFYNSQNDEVKQKVNGVAEQILNSSAMETLEKAKLLTQSSFRCVVANYVRKWILLKRRCFS